MSYKNQAPDIGDQVIFCPESAKNHKLYGEKLVVECNVKNLEKSWWLSHKGERLGFAHESSFYIVRGKK